MRGGFWLAPLDGIHVQDCRNSQGHIHTFVEDLDKERKTWFMPANYYNKGFSVEAIKKLDSAIMPHLHRIWIILYDCAFDLK